MRDLFQGEECYLKSTKEKIIISNVDRTSKPFKYWFKSNNGEYFFAHRKHLVIRKPK